MTKLGEYLDKIGMSPTLRVALVAAGVLASLVSNHHAHAADHSQAASQASTPAWHVTQNAPKILIDDLQIAMDMHERISDQIGGMMPLSDAMRHTMNSLASQKIPDVQKAKNIAIAFEFQLRQASHPELGRTDGFLVGVGNGHAPSPELSSLLRAINEKKKDMVEMAATLTEIENAYIRHDMDRVKYFSGRFAELARTAQMEVYEDDSMAAGTTSQPPGNKY